MARQKKTYNGWTKEHIQYLLLSNNRAVGRALIQIYNRQTAYEQRSEEAQVHNGVGFTAFDAEFLTSVAKGYLQYGQLTERQMPIVRKKMLKYWKQLLDIAAESGKMPTFDPPENAKRGDRARPVTPKQGNLV